MKNHVFIKPCLLLTVAFLIVFHFSHLQAADSLYSTSPSALELLSEFKSSSDKLRRKEIAIALAQVGTAALLPDLRVFVEKEKNFEVKSALLASIQVIERRSHDQSLVSEFLAPVPNSSTGIVQLSLRVTAGAKGGNLKVSLRPSDEGQARAVAGLPYVTVRIEPFEERIVRASFRLLSSEVLFVGEANISNEALNYQESTQQELNVSLK